MHTIEANSQTGLFEVKRTQEANTVKRVHRQVVVSSTPFHLVVGFYWREMDNHKLSGLKDTSFVYSLGGDLGEVEHALNFFVDGGFGLVIHNQKIIATSRYLDDKAEDFDYVADSIDPARALIGYMTPTKDQGEGRNHYDNEFPVYYDAQGREHAEF